MFDDCRLIVTNAIGGNPFARENSRARRQIVDRIGSYTLTVERRVFPDMHAARHLSNAITAIEGNDGPRRSAHLIARQIRNAELTPARFDFGQTFE
jgi:hypothetical protein